MRQILLIVFLLNSIFICCQTNYKEIKTEKLNTEKVLLAKSFIQSYLDKCLNKDYSGFNNYKLSKEHQKYVNERISELCINDEQKLGKISLENLNSAYKENISFFGGVELYIFDAKTEKDKNIKYLSVWISKDNIIEGMVITSYKPFKRKD